MNQGAMTGVTKVAATRSAHYMITSVQRGTETWWRTLNRHPFPYANQARMQQVTGAQHPCVNQVWSNAKIKPANSKNVIWSSFLGINLDTKLLGAFQLVRISLSLKLATTFSFVSIPFAMNSSSEIYLWTTPPSEEDQLVGSHW